MSPVTTTNTAAPALPAELETLMRQLKMPHARALAPELIATARAQRWEPTEIIKALFAEEAAGRARSMLATRRKAAGFPTGKTFDAWDPTVSSIPAPTQQALRTLEWITRRENLVVCGPSGTGNTSSSAGPPAPGKPSSSKPSASKPSKPACEWPGSDSKTSAP